MLISWLIIDVGMMHCVVIIGKYAGSLSAYGQRKIQT